MTRPPGRPPIPRELKVLRGQAPPKEKPSGDAPEVGAEPRDDLGEPGRRAWARYWVHARAWLKWTDLPLVERLCRLADDAAALHGAFAMTDEAGQDALMAGLLGEGTSGP
jgi:hypothetical protein